MIAARILVVSVALGALACSGASSSDIVDPLSTNTASSDPTLPSGSATGSAPSTTPAPAPVADGGAPMPDKKAPPECTPEIENNDQPGRANALTSCVTGVLDGPKDQDFFRVVVPAGARTMRIEHEETGDEVHYRVTEENVWFGLDVSFVEENREIDVRPGMSLVFRLSFTRRGNDAPRPYELAVAFE